MKKVSCFVFLAIMAIPALARQPGQTIRGTVTDRVTKSPLPGATVYLRDTDPVIGTSTDADGHYIIRNVPYRRTVVVCSFVGYSEYNSDDFIVTSAKEIVLNIEMDEGISIGGVTVSAVRTINEPLNELAYVSARSFSVEETERTPVGLNDVSKMAQSFPGTQQGRLDIENDIIVRGNSSFGMIWRLEGLDIPSPNHFARPGSSGGGISILSAQLMSRSDFYTGGMPAEFGNTLSAAFDIRLKNGNLTKYENRFKLSLIGIDYALEGPFKKDQSSFVFNYRYSMLGLLNRMGFHPTGINAFNEYTDFSFNTYFSMPKKKANLNIFGMGGLSTEIYNPINPASERDPDIMWHWEEVFFASQMATIGAVYTKLHSTRSFSKVAVAATSSWIRRYNDTLNLEDVHYRYRDDNYRDSRVVGTYVYSNRIDSSFRIKAGIIGTLIGFDFFQKYTARRTTLDINQFVLGGTQVEGSGITETAQAYCQGIYNVSSNFTVTGGFHFLTLFMNKTASIDPRLSVKYQINANNRLSLAVGKYSQHLPLPAYAYVMADTLSDGSILANQVNKNMKMMYSNHYILSYQYATPTKLKVQAEAYLQDLYHVPVAANPNSTYTMLNDNSEFPALQTSDEGRGLNYGIDVAVEKYTVNSFYFLLTGSLFSARYRPMDGQWYHNRFSSTWVSAFTVGKEFDFGKGRVLQVGTRFIHNGGHRYTTIDPVKSAAEGEYVALEGGFNASRMPAYWKFDGRIAYRFSRPKYAMNISLDMSNLTGHKNPNSVGYDADRNEVFFYYHTGNDFIPLLNIQIDF
ncbi:MAG TPA: hypothetical protein DC042_16265 [Bacteroidales bacterium]|nr:hypothetical protein [Bacteroidales bacterium]